MARLRDPRLWFGLLSLLLVVLLFLLDFERTSPGPLGATHAAVAELARLDREIAEVKVPLGYAEELFNARMHVRLVRSSLERELAGKA